MKKSPSKVMFGATVSAATVIRRVSKFGLIINRALGESQILLLNRVGIVGSGSNIPTKSPLSTGEGGGGGVEVFARIYKKVSVRFPEKKVNLLLNAFPVKQGE